MDGKPFLYICPICNGRGSVPASFYPEGREAGVVRSSSSTGYVTCRTCFGRGILWPPEPPRPANSGTPPIMVQAGG